MKSPRSRNWSIAVMAMMLLWGTSGISFSRMTCLMSGHAIYSIGALDDCCPAEQADGPVINATCCDFGSVTNDVDEVMPGHQLALSVPIDPAVVAAEAGDARSESSLWHGWLASRPPPLLTQQRLSSLRRLRI